ncbi:MAG: hypothetical protein AAFV53_32855, partial [Myxococcota bacterium]
MSKHNTEVRKNIKKIEMGDKRAFFFAVDGDRRVLHVSKKDGSSGRFGSIKKVNAFLKRKKFGEPLDQNARLCAGKVIRTPEALFFSLKVKKGATASDLLRGAKKLRSALKLKSIRIGEPSSGEDSGKDSQQEQERQQHRLDQLLQAASAAMADLQFDSATIEVWLERAMRASEKVSDLELDALIGRLEDDFAERQRREKDAESILAALEAVHETRSFIQLDVVERRVQVHLNQEGYLPLHDELTGMLGRMARGLKILGDLREQQAALRSSAAPILAAPEQVSDEALAALAEQAMAYLAERDEVPGAEEAQAMLQAVQDEQRQRQEETPETHAARQAAANQARQDALRGQYSAFKEGVRAVRADVEGAGGLERVRALLVDAEALAAAELPEKQRRRLRDMLSELTATQRRLSTVRRAPRMETDLGALVGGVMDPSEDEGLHAILMRLEWIDNADDAGLMREAQLVTAYQEMRAWIREHRDDASCHDQIDAMEEAMSEIEGHLDVLARPSGTPALDAYRDGGVATPEALEDTLTWYCEVTRKQETIWARSSEIRAELESPDLGEAARAALQAERITLGDSRQGLQQTITRRMRAVKEIEEALLAVQVRDGLTGGETLRALGSGALGETALVRF